MANHTFRFTAQNPIHELPIEVSRHYQIERMEINAIALDNLEHVLEGTAIYFAWYNPGGAIRLPLDTLEIPETLTFEVPMDIIIDIPEESDKATISIIDGVFPPIHSITIELYDFN